MGQPSLRPLKWDGILPIVLQGAGCFCAPSGANDPSGRAVQVLYKGAENSRSLATGDTYLANKPTLRPTDVVGSKAALYCRQHVEDGMVNVTSKRCGHEGCGRHPRFRVADSKTALYCRQHAEDGMGYVRKRCCHKGCTKEPSFGLEGSKAALYCKQHAEDGMVGVRSKPCGRWGCSNNPSFGVEGSKAALYCSQHAEEGMVNILKKRYGHEDCSKQSSFGVEGSKAALCCKQHAEDGMVDVKNKLCVHQGCSKYPSFGVEGSKALYCRQHAEDGMVDVKRKCCGHEGCSMRGWFGVEGSKAAVYCHQHVKDLTARVTRRHANIDAFGLEHKFAGKARSGVEGLDSSTGPTQAECESRPWGGDSLEELSRPASDEIRQGDTDGRREVKRVRQAAEDLLTSAGKAARFGADPVREATTAWCDLKVETSFSM